MPSEPITSTEVMSRGVVRIGSRVKHFGQRWTGCATATVIGFERIGDPGVENPMGFRPGWVKIVVEPDSGDAGLYGNKWDWDRTEVAPDV